MDTLGSKFKVPSSKFKVHAVSVILSGVYVVEGSVNVSKTIVKHTFTDASFVSMTKTA